MSRSLLLLLLLISSFGLSPGARAQSGSLRFGANCSADSMQQEAFRRDPAYRQSYETLVREAARIAANPSATPERVLPDVTVPVVIHVIYNSASTNISDAQVLDAIRIVNEDFQKQNRDTIDIIPAFEPIIGNIGFQFRLAQKDPNGNCTTGITRTFSTQTNGASDAVKNLIRWDPSRYLNVWVVTSIGSGAGGYAYLPCASPAIDGIVIRSDQFGSIGRAGNSNFARRSFTHEIGHYFGLLHTWGASNTPGAPNNCSIDDGVADTPNTSGVSSQTCPLSFAPCGVLTNVQNYLDYSSCGSMFTLGQRALMRASLTRTCRTTLVSAQNLIDTGTNDGYVPVLCPPVAAFRIIGSGQICAGGQVSFSDESYNTNLSQAQFLWTLPGATPATATTRTPTVVYSQPGVYDVELRVTNTFGYDTATVKRRIRVIGASAGEQAPYVESFEATSWPFKVGDANKDWVRSTSSVTGITWSRSNFGGSTGTASVQINNGAVAAGSVSTLITPNINLTQAGSSVAISFDRAYALKTNGSGQDFLNVDASIDCGNTWTNLRFLTATDLASITQTYTSYAVPNAGDWQRLTIPVPAAFQNSPVFQVRLSMTSQGGNNFFLDNFRVSAQTSASRNMANRSIGVAPNPVTAETAVLFRLDQPTKAQVQVLDLLGRTVLTLPQQTLAAGQQRIALGAEGQRLRPGVYVVQLTLGQERFTSRVVVQ